jgi:hypothetical protein
MTSLRWAALAAIAGMLALILAAWLTQPARAQGAMCGPASEIIKSVTGEKYAEAPVIKGLMGDSYPMTVFANPKTGTWTAIFLTPDGRACIFGAGVEFEPMPASKPGEPT